MDLEVVLEASQHGGESLMLATVACGDEYHRTWQRFAQPNWERFAARHGYGLAVLRETLFPPKVAYGWNKFVLPKSVRDRLGHEGHVLVLDADQSFSPIAPPIELAPDVYGLVPLEAWTDDTVRNRKLTGFLRRQFLDSDYPLDSVLIMSADDWEAGGLLDLAGQLPISSGFMLIPPGLIDDLAGLAEFAYHPDAAWDGGGGDQIFASRELQQRPHRFLDRRWQGIWPNIMSDRYPALYFDAPVAYVEAQRSIASALFDHWCIHFATSWPEKQYWQVDWMAYWDERLGVRETDLLNEYLAADVTPRSYGRLAAPDIALIQDIGS